MAAKIDVVMASGSCAIIREAQGSCSCAQLPHLLFRKVLFGHFLAAWGFQSLPHYVLHSRFLSHHRRYTMPPNQGLRPSDIYPSCVGPLVHVFSLLPVTGPCPPGALSTTASSPTAGVVHLLTTYLRFRNYCITTLRVWTKYQVRWYLMPSQCIV
ncbi:hypothetical protein B0H10DRAFT_2013404 [Mycena sp. CBHHK59/15]|nr:hypothetical protein B0H10DRAFT_2013404 [Mycena sp. CBHHK59/15]